jgi:hypothetical protein
MLPHLLQSGHWFWNPPYAVKIFLVFASLVVLANGCRRWVDRAFKSQYESTTESAPRWSLRPSNLLIVLAAGFFIYRWPGHRLDLKFISLRSDLWVSAIVFCLAFLIRRWENEALRGVDDSGGDDEKVEDSPQEDGKLD